MDRIERYTQVRNFLEGLQTIENIEIAGQNPKDIISFSKAHTDKHWVYLLILPKDRRGDDDFNYILEEVLLDTNTFAVYFNKFKDEIVVKASILSSYGKNTKADLCNKLSDRIKKIGFKNISYDSKVVGGIKPKTFVKVLFDKDKEVKDLYSLYQIIKQYNEVWFDEWRNSF